MKSKRLKKLQIISIPHVFLGIWKERNAQIFKEIKLHWIEVWTKVVILIMDNFNTSTSRRTRSPKIKFLLFLSGGLNSQSKLGIKTQDSIVDGNPIWKDHSKEEYSKMPQKRLSLPLQILLIIKLATLLKRSYRDGDYGGKGFFPLEIEGDFKTIIDHVKNASKLSQSIEILIEYCSSILKNKRVILISHIFHEANQLEDRLDKISIYNNKGHIWESSLRR